MRDQQTRRRSPARRPGGWTTGVTLAVALAASGVPADAPARTGAPAQAQTQAQTQAQAQAQTQPQAQPQAQPQTQPQTTPQTRPQSAPQSAPQSRPAPSQQRRPEPEIEGIVDGDPIIKLIPKDRIVPVDHPEMVPASEAGDFMADDEMILGVVEDGRASAYSTWHLDRHEVVNDRLGETPITATW